MINQRVKLDLYFAAGDRVVQLCLEERVLSLIGKLAAKSHKGWGKFECEIQRLST
jgi:hypothetical protein